MLWANKPLYISTSGSIYSLWKIPFINILRTAIFLLFSLFIFHTFVNHESVHQLLLLLAHWFFHQFYPILYQQLLCMYKKSRSQTISSLRKCNQCGIQDILLKHLLLFFNCLLVVMQLSLFSFNNHCSVAHTCCIRLVICVVTCML